MSKEVLTEQEYRQLKKKVDEAKSNSDQAKGALGQLTKRLKEEFACSSLKEGKILLEKLSKERDEVQKKLEDEMEAYKDKWNED